MAPKDPPPGDKQSAEERRQAALKEVTEEYDRRLAACFNSPDFGDRVDAVMDACGCTKKRPIAGESY